MRATRVLIVNPFASGVDERRLAAVQKALPSGTETVLTTARGEATELARDWSPRAEAIYVFSGDGTYNEVINGIEADVPVGFVPGGGTSVLPRALGFPRDPVRSATRITNGRPRRISLGSLNGRRFAFNAGIGFDAELVRRVDELGRRPDGKRPGDVRFALTVARTLVAHRLRYESALEIEGLGERRSRSSPTALRTPTRAGSAFASPPMRRSREGSTSSPHARCEFVRSRASQRRRSVAPTAPGT